MSNVQAMKRGSEIVLKMAGVRWRSVLRPMLLGFSATVMLVRTCNRLIYDNFWCVVDYNNVEVTQVWWEFATCLQKSARQCCDVTKLDCTHCSGHRQQLEWFSTMMSQKPLNSRLGYWLGVKHKLAQSLLTPHHCLASILETNKSQNVIRLMLSIVITYLVKCTSC